MGARIRRRPCCAIRANQGFVARFAPMWCTSELLEMSREIECKSPLPKLCSFATVLCIALVFARPSAGSSHHGRYPQVMSSVRASETAPYPWLLADVGGSNARFAWMSAPGQAPQHVRTLAVAEHPQLVDAARAYLSGLAVSGLIAPSDQPASAALAVATAVTGDAVRFTNSAWSFSQRELAQHLGLRTLVVLNDFEALALSLPRLRPEQVQGAPAVAHRRADGRGRSGHGLGRGGFAAQRPQGWLALPGEGGHATLAPSRRLRIGPAGRGSAGVPARLGRAVFVGHRSAGFVPRRGASGGAAGPYRGWMASGSWSARWPTTMRWPVALWTPSAPCSVALRARWR